MRVRTPAIISAAGILLGLLLSLAIVTRDRTPKPLSADELKALTEKKQKFFFLDVREPVELEKLGTMKGFVNIPLSQLEGRLSEVPRDSLVVTA